MKIRHIVSGTALAAVAIGAVVAFSVRDAAIPFDPTVSLDVPFKRDVVWQEMQADGRVLAVSRSLYFDAQNKPSFDEVRSQVEKKYGVPTLIQHTYEGDIADLKFFYSGGELVAAPTPMLCKSTGAAEDCGSYTKTPVQKAGQPGYVVQARTPCAGFEVYSRTAEKGSTSVWDEACDGLLSVRFIGPLEGLERIDFRFEDAKQTYADNASPEPIRAEPTEKIRL